MSKILFPNSARPSTLKRDTVFSIAAGQTVFIGLGRVPNVGLAADAPPNPLADPTLSPDTAPPNDPIFNVDPSLPPNEGTATPEPAAVIGTATTSNSDFDSSGCLKSNAAANSPMRSMQTKLNALGYKGSDGKPLTVDGLFGANSRFAVKAFQKDHGLVVDGCPGSNTLVALQKATASAGAGNQPIPSKQTGPGGKPAPTPLPPAPKPPAAKPAAASSSMSPWLIGGMLAAGAGAGLYYFNKKKRGHV